MKKILLLLLLPLSFSANAVTVTGKVAKYRTFPAAQPVVSARNHVVFSLDKPLSPECDILYLSPDDTTSISLLLAAKISNTEVTVTFNDTASPWHNRTCNTLELSVE